MDTQQSPEDPTLKAFETPYNEYIGALAGISDELSARLMEAQKSYAEAGAAGPESAASAHDKAIHGYIGAVRATWEGSQQKYGEAYASYVEAYREAWANVDPASMSPQALAMIGQSAAAAAGYAASTIGNWSLVAATGIPPWALSTPR